MKKTGKILALSILLISFFVSGCQNDNILSPTESDPVLRSSSIIIEESDLLPGDLSPEEEAGLIRMRIEEKLARDVYIKFGDDWNHKVFGKIESSERMHMEAILALLVNYDVPDPITDDTPGVFPNSEFQDLYDEYIDQGGESYQKALLVGKTIEEDNIIDLEYQISFVDNMDILIVYGNLKAGSERHRAAFLRHIEIL